MGVGGASYRPALSQGREWERGSQSLRGSAAVPYQAEISSSDRPAALRAGAADIAGEVVTAITTVRSRGQKRRTVLVFTPHDLSASPTVTPPAPRQHEDADHPDNYHRNPWNAEEYVPFEGLDGTDGLARVGIDDLQAADVLARGHTVDSVAETHGKHHEAGHTGVKVQWCEHRETPMDFAHPHEGNAKVDDEAQAPSCDERVAALPAGTYTVDGRLETAGRRYSTAAQRAHSW